MLSLGLSASEEEAFKDALKDGSRQVRYRARLYGANGNPQPKELELIDGEVIVDVTQAPDAPTRTAHVTLADPKRLLSVDTTDVSSSGLWFSMSLGLWWGIWIPSLDRWIDVPVFHGPIFQVARSGAEVMIDAQGKEAQHIPPHTFYRSFSVRRHTKIHRAIRAIMEHRGETKFSFDETTRRVPRDRTWHSKASPWKAVINLARGLNNKHLFFDGSGTLRLRSEPSRPSWSFVEGENAVLVDDVEEKTSMERVRNAVVIIGERMAWRDVKTKTRLSTKAAIGATSIEVASDDKFQAGRKIQIGDGDNAETRTIGSAYVSGTTIPLGRALDNKHPKGAKVTVAHRQRKAVPVVGRAQLGQNHPWSAEALTGGKRPRVRFEDRPNIHKKKTAETRASNVIENMKIGVLQEVSLTCVPIPHLEEMDYAQVQLKGFEGWLVLERFTIPLSLEDPMVIGWQGRRVPHRRSRG